MNWLKKMLRFFYQSISNLFLWVRNKTIVIFLSIVWFFTFSSYKKKIVEKKERQYAPLPRQEEDEDDEKDIEGPEIETMQDMSMSESYRDLGTASPSLAINLEQIDGTIHRIYPPIPEEKELSSPSLHSSIDAEVGDEILYRRFLEEQEEEDRAFIFQGIPAHLTPWRHEPSSRAISPSDSDELDEKKGVPEFH